MDHVVVDVEIQNTIEETPGGWDATDKLGVAVACVWEYNGNRMRVYGPEDVEELRRRLLAADRISGFNIRDFDYPVIWGISKPHWAGRCTDLTSDQSSEIHDGIKPLLVRKTDDMLQRIWAVRDRSLGGCKLDDVAKYTLGASKIGNGAEAPHWYKAGQVQRVVNYCADDVALERDLTDFVDRYGYVVLQSGRLSVPKWKAGV